MRLAWPGLQIEIGVITGAGCWLALITSVPAWAQMTPTQSSSQSTEPKKADPNTPLPKLGEPVGDAIPFFKVEYNKFTDSTTLKGPKLDKMTFYARMEASFLGQRLPESFQTVLRFEFKDIDNARAIPLGAEASPFKTGGMVYLLFDDGAARATLPIVATKVGAAATTPVYRGWAIVSDSVLRLMSTSTKIEAQFFASPMGKWVLPSDTPGAAGVLLRLKGAEPQP